MVAAVVDRELHEAAPVVVHAKYVGVTHDEEEALGSGDSHIHALRRVQKAQALGQVEHQTFLTHANRGNEDDWTLLALELLDAANLRKKQQK